MPSNAKRLFPIDIDERRALAQLFCLALRNVQAYGAEHTVSATTLRSFYDQVVDLLDRFPEIVWSDVEGKILLNGEPCELRTADDVLATRMRACGLETFTFVDTISRVELNRFVTWLATGVESSHAGEAYVGIRIADSVYARISADQLDGVGEEKAGSGMGAGGSSKSARAGVKQFDLDSMLQETPDGDFGVGSGGGTGSGVGGQAVGGFIQQQRAADEQRKNCIALIQHATNDPQALEALQKQFFSAGGSKAQWNELCWQAQACGGPKGDGGSVQRNEQILKLREDLDALQKRCAMGQVESESVAQELGKLSSSVNSLLAMANTQTDSLVEKVNADREQIAKLEQDARDSGAPIHLSREELLESLAEINQELVQPLTVSAALVELLSSGRLGDVDENQKKVFDLASESLQRLEVVMKYLQKLSGMPINLIPDQGLLREVYGVDSED